MFLLDTDHISILQWQTEPEYGRLTLRMTKLPDADFYFSIVSFHEQTLGAHDFVKRAKKTADLLYGYEIFEVLRADYSKVQVLPYDAPAHAEFSTLKAKKLKVGTMDLRIAAIGLVHNFVVLTRNTVDFKQVPGLKVEDWTV